MASWLPGKMSESWVWVFLGFVPPLLGWYGTLTWNPTGRDPCPLLLKDYIVLKFNIHARVEKSMRMKRSQEEKKLVLQSTD